MFFFNTIAVLFLGLTLLASPASSQEDNTATVLNDISSITTEIATLRHEVDTYDYCSPLHPTREPPVFPITDTDFLYNLIGETTTDIGNSSPFGDADSTNIINATNTLTIQFAGFLEDIGFKRFSRDLVLKENEPLNTTIALNFESLYSKTDAFFAALATKVIYEDQAVVVSDQTSIDNAFDFVLLSLKKGLRPCLELGS